MRRWLLQSFTGITKLEETITSDNAVSEMWQPSADLKTSSLALSCAVLHYKQWLGVIVSRPDPSALISDGWWLTAGTKAPSVCSSHAVSAPWKPGWCLQFTEASWSADKASFCLSWSHLVEEVSVWSVLACCFLFLYVPNIEMKSDR